MIHTNNNVTCYNQQQLYLYVSGSFKVQTKCRLITLYQEKSFWSRMLYSVVWGPSVLILFPSACHTPWTQRCGVPDKITLLLIRTPVTPGVPSADCCPVAEDQCVLSVCGFQRTFITYFLVQILKKLRCMILYTCLYVLSCYRLAHSTELLRISHAKIFMLHNNVLVNSKKSGHSMYSMFKC